MRVKIVTAITWGSEGFGFMWFWWLWVILIYELDFFFLIINLQKQNIMKKLWIAKFDQTYQQSWKFDLQTKFMALYVYYWDELFKSIRSMTSVNFEIC